jgi:hypothetical protein
MAKSHQIKAEIERQNKPESQHKQIEMRSVGADSSTAGRTASNRDRTNHEILRS